MSGALRRYGRNLLAAVAMVGALAGVAFGLPALDHALPDSAPAPPGRPYGVGGGVTVVPPVGSAVDLTRTRPAARRGTAVFLLGAVTYAVTVEPFDGTLDDATGRLRRRVRDSAGVQPAGTELEISTAAGLAGRAGGWTASGRGGRYAVFLVHGLAVDVMISGTDAELRATAATTDASTRSLQFGSDR